MKQQIFSRVIIMILYSGNIHIPDEFTPLDHLFTKMREPAPDKVKGALAKGIEVEQMCP
jgi:hypothetical protein